MGETLGLLAVLLGGSVAASSNGLTNTVLAGAALIAIVAGIAAAVYAAKNKAALRATEVTTKAALQAAEVAATAWREERDATQLRAERLEAALRETDSKRVAAEARTDITRLEKLVTKQHADLTAILSGIEAALRAATTAVEFLAKQGAAAFPAGD